MPRKKPEDMSNGSKFKMKLGNHLVINRYDKNSHVEVEFIETGYKTIATAGRIRRGSVIDKLQPRIYGVGFIGDGKNRTNGSAINSLAYDRWTSMMKRCYDEKYHKVKPTYKDCTVCKEWHNFQNFCEWFIENYPRDGKVYHLDKDYIFDGNKVYSPETCKFLTPFENNQISHEKTYTLINPEGETVEIKNLSRYCRDNNINRGSLKGLFSGSTKCYKGWRLP